MAERRITLGVIKAGDPTPFPPFKESKSTATIANDGKVLWIYGNGTDITSIEISIELTYASGNTTISRTLAEDGGGIDSAEQFNSVLYYLKSDQYNPIKVEAVYDARTVYARLIVNDNVYDVVVGVNNDLPSSMSCRVTFNGSDNGFDKVALAISDELIALNKLLNSLSN